MQTCFICIFKYNLFSLARSTVTVNTIYKHYIDCYLKCNTLSLLLVYRRRHFDVVPLVFCITVLHKHSMLLSVLLVDTGVFSLIFFSSCVLFIISLYIYGIFLRFSMWQESKEISIVCPSSAPTNLFSSSLDESRKRATCIHFLHKFLSINILLKPSFTLPLSEYIYV